MVEVKCNTLWLKKQGLKLFSVSSPDINRFSKYIHGHTPQKICNNNKDPSTPQRCRCTTFWNISFQKLLKAQQWQTRDAHTKENMTAISELVLSQEGQPRIHRPRRQIAQFDVVWIVFFCRDLGLKCFKRCLLKNWLMQTECETWLLKTIAEWCYFHLFQW